jgi:hypothetical protein
MLHLLEIDQLRTEAPSERLQCEVKNLQTRIVAICSVRRMNVDTIIGDFGFASSGSEVPQIVSTALTTQARPVRYSQTFVRDELVFCLPVQRYRLPTFLRT